MKDNLSIVITIILLVVLIVIFPLYNYFERQDDMSYNLALKATTNFVDEVLNSGYITEQMYSDYVSELANTGNTYDISLEAHRKKLGADAKETDVYDEIYIVDYNEAILDMANENVSNVTLESTSIKNGVYSLNKDDKFYVKLKNSSITMAGAIFNIIVPTSKEERIVVNYGGIVKNSAWEKVDSTFSAHMRDPEAPVISTIKATLRTTLEGEELLENVVSIGKIPTLKAESAVYSVTGMEDNRVEKYVWQDVSTGTEYIVNPNNNEKISEKIGFMIDKTYTFSVYAEDTYRNKSPKVFVNFTVTKTPRPSTPVVGIKLGGEDKILSTTVTNTVEIDDMSTLWAVSTGESDIAYYTWTIRDENGNYIAKTTEITKYKFEFNKTYKLVVEATDVEGETCEVPCTVTINVVEFLNIDAPMIKFTVAGNNDLEEVQVFKGNTVGVTVSNAQEDVTYTWYVNGSPVMTGKTAAIKIDKLMDNEIYCIATRRRGSVKSTSTLKVWGYNYNVANELDVQDKETIEILVTVHNYHVKKIDNLGGDKNVFYHWNLKSNTLILPVKDSGTVNNSKIYTDAGNDRILLTSKSRLWFTGAATMTVYVSNSSNTIVSNKIAKVFTII